MVCGSSVDRIQLSFKRKMETDGSVFPLDVSDLRMRRFFTADFKILSKRPHFDPRRHLYASYLCR